MSPENRIKEIRSICIDDAVEDVGAIVDSALCFVQLAETAPACVIHAAIGRLEGITKDAPPREWAVLNAMLSYLRVLVHEGKVETADHVPL